MKYKSYYTVEDLVMDTCFQEWVQNPTEQADMFWESWILANPSQRETVAEARAIINAMAFEHKTMPVSKAEAIWKALEVSMSDAPKVENTIKHTKAQFIRTSSNRRYSFMKIAASFAAIILLATAVFTYQYFADTINYTTAYGETREVQLPDGSVVVLNANSNLSFANRWPETGAREVWLNGEAFFSVVQKLNRQKFIVHTDDLLQVEVLGTEFNITKRKNKTRIVLENGQILLNIHPNNKKDALKQRLLMKPGELVEFDDMSDRYIKKKVNPEVYSSWKSNKLLLDDTSLLEIIQLLENTYGYQVAVKSNHLLQQKVSGSIPLGDKETLLQHIAQTFEIRISRKGNSVLFYPMK